uniref:DNA polymerase III subunit delta n=1 Tax=Lacticaseibacillus camelliae TaxID=381742 RepID=UPI000B098068
LAFGRWQWLGGWVILTWLVVNVHPQYRVTMFDVGQGDSLLIEAPFKQGAILIDTGGRGFGFSANPPAKRVIVNYLRARGITHLDALVLTHADADHVGDAAVLTRLMPVKTLVTTPLAASHPYILAAKAGRVTQHVQVLAGQTLAIGPLKLRVVAPSDASATEKNADSIVLYGKIGDSNWLFTGDADQGVETRELMPQALEVDMLKVGHHGSKTSSAPEFIQQIKPKLALISAGVNNRYGHPHQETLTTLQAAGVPWLNTAAGGAVWVDASSKASVCINFYRKKAAHDRSGADQTVEKKGELPPLVLLLGTEQALVDQALAALKAVIPPDQQTMNYATYDMRQTAVGVALDDAASPPFFGDWREVVISDPYFLTGEKPKSGPEHDVQGLEAYFKQPAPSTVMVVVAPYEKLDARKNVVKALNRSAKIVNVAPLDQRAAEAAVQRELKAQHLQITPDALNALVQRTAGEYTAMVHELPKLKLYAAEGATIDAAAVDELVPKALTDRVFDLVDAVVRKNTTQALSLYRDLLLQKEEPIHLNALLVMQFRLLLQVQILAKKRV